MGEVPQVQSPGNVAQIVPDVETSKLRASRRLRVALLVVGALVAFTGIAITYFVKNGLEKNLESAQSRYSNLQALRVQTYDQVQQARRDAQTALVLGSGAKYVAEMQYYARYYAWDAANKIKETLDRRVNKMSARKANRSAASPAGSMSACSLPSQPDRHIPTKPTSTSEATVSFVGSLADPWNCFNDRLSSVMSSDELQIRDYRERIRQASTIATGMQLIGILIAFSKDFFN